jgi:predicted phosphodiesterase
MFRFAQHDSTVVKRGVRIFVLADTHNRLPESVTEMAQGADEIWHLGDVCAEAILDELRAIGPRVTVVRGNCDGNFEWPLVLDLARGGLKIRLQHIPPDHLPDDVAGPASGGQLLPTGDAKGLDTARRSSWATQPVGATGCPSGAKRVDVLLHGHTHVPRNERRGRVLFLNPGCVTRPNRGAPPSVAWLEITDGKIHWELVPLR